MDKEKKVSNLSELEVIEVSLVGRPANKRRFLLVKNDGTEQELNPSEQMESLIRAEFKAEADAISGDTSEVDIDDYGDYFSKKEAENEMSYEKPDYGYPKPKEHYSNTTGIERAISLCPRCLGDGFINRSVCQRCSGTGNIGGARLETRVQCPDCRGQGTIPAGPCSYCEAKGFLIKGDKTYPAKSNELFHEILEIAKAVHTSEGLSATEALARFLESAWGKNLYTLYAEGTELYEQKKKGG